MSVKAEVTSIAVEGGKSVVNLMVNGSRYQIDTNLVGFAQLAKLGIPVQTVQAYKSERTAP